MRVSAKADYAVRAAAELATTEGGGPVKAERIAEAQEIPIKFLETILLELKHAGIVRSQRGPDGGYALARPADGIALADVIRAVDGPLANVRGDRWWLAACCSRERNPLPMPTRPSASAIQARMRWANSGCILGAWMARRSSRPTSRLP